VPKYTFAGAELVALDEREDRDSPTAAEVERRPVEGGQRRNDLVDLLRQEPHQLVLPTHALRIHTLGTHREVARPNEGTGRSPSEPFSPRGKRKPVALGDTFG